MGQLSPVLRNAVDGGLTFWCPGCKQAHQIKTGNGPGPRWGWNGNAEKPTFTPSVLVTGRDFTEKGEAEWEAWIDAGSPRLEGGELPQFESADTVCHTFVTDGRIQFLGDCTHALAGQTVDMAPWPRAET